MKRQIPAIKIGLNTRSTYTTHMATYCHTVCAVDANVRKCKNRALPISIGTPAAAAADVTIVHSLCIQLFHPVLITS